MYKPRPFRFHDPATIEDALWLVERLGDEARLYAGGTELLLVMKSGLLRCGHLIDVKKIEPLGGILWDAAGGVLDIGATVRHRDLERSPEIRRWFRLIAEAESSVANVRVRSTGTIGGNLCFAEPHSDPGTFLLLYDAKVRLRSRSGGRAMSLEDFFVGAYETARREEELLTRILVPCFPEGTGAAYFKFGSYERPTLSLGASVRLDRRETIRELRIAVGSVGPRPIRARQVERLLEGATLREAETRLEEAGRITAECAQPTDDFHGSAEYKSHLVGVFLKRALRLACERAGKP